VEGRKTVLSQDRKKGNNLRSREKSRKRGRRRVRGGLLEGTARVPFVWRSAKRRSKQNFEGFRISLRWSWEEEKSIRKKLKTASSGTASGERGGFKEH